MNSNIITYKYIAQARTAVTISTRANLALPVTFVRVWAHALIPPRVLQTANTTGSYMASETDLNAAAELVLLYQAM